MWFRYNSPSSESLDASIWTEKGRPLLLLSGGVTRVGDTRGGNWGCHPSTFSWKTWRPFFAHRCHYHCRFLLLSLPSRVSPHTFLPVRLRFSNILCKFAHKNFFSFGYHPLEGVTRGGPPAPHSDANAYCSPTEFDVSVIYVWKF